MAKDTKIAVLESKWWPRKNTSVRGLFDVLSEIHCNNGHGYHYEMFMTNDAVKEALQRVPKYKNIKYLSIACHGDQRGLDISEYAKKQKFTAGKVGVALGKSNSSLTGLHLGCCDFGTEKTAQLIFSKGAKLRWIAGYSTEASWIQSSALDLMFFDMLLLEDRNNKAKRTPAKKIEFVANSLRESCGGLIDYLGFGIYVRKRGKSGGVRNLLEPLEQEE